MTIESEQKIIEENLQRQAAFLEQERMKQVEAAEKQEQENRERMEREQNQSKS